MVLSAQARPEPPLGAPGVGVPASALPELERIAALSKDKITSENFPVALRVLPRRVGEHLRSAYAYARFVDDVGDEAAGDRLALLDAVEADVRALPAGGARLAPVRGLEALVRDHGLDVSPLLDLVEANRRDQRVSRYATFDDLLDYCRLSAAPVGRIVLAVAHVDDAAALERSDRVCVALQVLEHCQDVGEDFAAGRVYLPAADLREAGASDADLRATTTSPALRRVVARQVSRSATLLADGGPLVRQLSGWARLAVLGYVAGGRATAAALREAQYDVLARHIGPSTFGTARQAAAVVTSR